MKKPAPPEKPVVLSFDRRSTTEQDLLAVRDIVQQFPGTRRLDFRFFDDDGNRLRMLAGTEIRVIWNAETEKKFAPWMRARKSFLTNRNLFSTQGARAPAGGSPAPKTCRRRSHLLWSIPFRISAAGSRSAGFTRIVAFAILAGARALAATPEDEVALEPYQAPPAPTSEDWPREKMLGFLRDLANFVERYHVVTDPHRKTYGMVYEFWKDGKKMQEFGLDSMHDGAWWMSALITAHRADPQGDWLARAQKYTIPFYTNLLNHSDRLFPKMQPSEEDKRPWAAPVKGW